MEGNDDFDQVWVLTLPTFLYLLTWVMDRKWSCYIFPFIQPECAPVLWTPQAKEYRGSDAPLAPGLKLRGMAASTSLSWSCESLPKKFSPEAAILWRSPLVWVEDGENESCLKIFQTFEIFKLRHQEQQNKLFPPLPGSHCQPTKMMRYTNNKLF